jgi:hypothetical protein
LSKAKYLSILPVLVISVLAIVAFLLLSNDGGSTSSAVSDTQVADADYAVSDLAVPRDASALATSSVTTVDVNQMANTINTNDDGTLSLVAIADATALPDDRVSAVADSTIGANTDNLGAYSSAAICDDTTCTASFAVAATINDIGDDCTTATICTTTATANATGCTNLGSTCAADATAIADIENDADFKAIATAMTDGSRSLSSTGTMTVAKTRSASKIAGAGIPEVTGALTGHPDSGSTVILGT